MLSAMFVCVCAPGGTRFQVGVHLEQALKLEAFLPEQYLCSFCFQPLTYFLLRNEGRSVLPTPCSSQPFKTVGSPILLSAATLVFFTLLLQDLSILLSTSFSHCLNPFLARPEAPFPCHVNFSRQGDLFPYHHVLHFLQLPRRFLQGI